ncbi:MAG TPA: MFS transporter [Burkholderiales bacterium]|nr:MFS transporter [Burkholderiales bacterium]
MDTSLATPVIVVLAMANFAIALTYSAIVPLIPILLDSADDAQKGMGAHTGGVTSVYMFALFAGALASRRMSERFSSRRLVAGALLGNALATIGLALSSGLSAIYVLRAFGGFIAGVAAPVTATKIAMVQGPERRARLFALMGMATLVGYLLGPGVSAGILSITTEFISQRALLPLAAPAALAFAVAIAVLLCKEWREGKAPGPNVGANVRHPLPHRLVGANFIGQLGLAAFEVLLLLVAMRGFGAEPGTLAALFAECTLVMIVVQLALFMLPTLANQRFVPTIAFLALMIGTGLLGLANEIETLYIAVFTVAGASAWLSLNISLAASKAGSHHSSVSHVMATIAAAATLGQGFGATLAGALYDGMEASGAWVVSLIMAGAGVVAMHQWRSRPPSIAAQVIKKETI